MATPSIEQQLSEAEVFIGNGLAVPEIQQVFDSARHGADHFEEGQKLFDSARQLHQAQHAEYGDQYMATEALNRLREEADRRYRLHLELARLAFRGDVGAQKALHLSGGRKRSFPRWLEQTTLFYNNLLADAALMAEMERFGVGADELEAARREVDGVAQANQDQEREIGEAQKATLRRDEALDALAEWMSTSRALARILLADDPQQLEKMGLLARS